MGTNGRAGRNVRRQHPYAGNKYPAKAAAKRQQGKQNPVHQPSLQRTSVHNSAKQESAKPGAHPRQGNPNKAKADARGDVLRLPSLEQWDTESEIHNLPVMVSLREELRMQMWSVHTRYDCARKVLMNHLDLQKLPERQAKGALQKIWTDWSFSNKKTRKEAYKASQGRMPIA